MTQHTPAPLHVEPLEGYEGHGLAICNAERCQVVAIIHPDSGLTLEDHANAALFASATDLLAALEECVRAYENHRDSQPTGHLWPDPNHIFHAKRAIARSKGDAS